MTTTNIMARRQGGTARVTPHPHRLIWLTALCFGISAGLASLRGTAESPLHLHIAAEPKSAATGLEQSCQAGDAIACNDLGVSLLHGDLLHGVQLDQQLAAQAFERSCTRGSPDGCSNLGALYERSIGVADSLERAVELYTQACSHGAALGCSNLGALQARGRGLPRDVQEAQRLFRQACEGGSAMGCSNLLQLQGR